MSDSVNELSRRRPMEQLRVAAGGRNEEEFRNGCDRPLPPRRRR